MPYPTAKKQSIPSLSLSKCIAKTYTDQNGQRQPGCTVLTHSKVVGYVTQYLCSIHHQYKALMPKNYNTILAAALHDLGKVSFEFQFITLEQHKLYNIDINNISSEKFYHSQISYLSCKDELKLEHTMAIVLGWHHGFYTNPENENMYKSGEWTVRREELYKELCQIFGEPAFPKLTEIQQILLCGIITLSDWLASSYIFDDINRGDFTDFTYEDIKKRIENTNIKFKIEKIANKNFEDIFGFTPNATQEKFINMPEYDVTILEDTMGSGKTEAAFYYAYKLLQSGKCTGIYYALPTQLTSEIIYERFQKFRDAISNEKAFLTFQNSWLKEGVEKGDKWFDSNRKLMILPFSVGTIDQLLLGGIKARFFYIRVFSMIGKVIIIDELHSYDIYTRTLIRNMLPRLREIGCKIIILSATLTNKIKCDLLQKNVTNSTFPLITTLNKHLKGFGQLVNFTAIKAPPPKEVSIQKSPSIDYNKIIQLYNEGNKIAIILNTVDEAANVYSMLKNKISNSILLHSRFLKYQRNKIEGDVIKKFGSKSQDVPYVVVSTQIIEQSLDFDVDYMVSKLCPIDLLLQRMGRLWRHNKARKLPCPTIEVIIPSSNEAKEFVEDIGSDRFIYPVRILHNTAQILPDKILIPDNIKPLCEQVYNHVNTEDWLQKEKQHEDIKSTILTLKACGEIPKIHKIVQTSDDEVHFARNIEYEFSSVLICKSITDDGVILHNGSSIPAVVKDFKKEHWRNLLLNIVPIPKYRINNQSEEHIFSDVRSVDFVAVQNAYGQLSFNGNDSNILYDNTLGVTKHEHDL